MRKIGILGGTFNPVHNGHIKIALEAYEYLRLDKLLLIPSGYSYMKSDEEIAPATMRLEMLMLAVRDYPQLTVSDMELKREGPTYTYETIKELRETYVNSEFYFIIGADTLVNMENWKNPADIFENVTIVVKNRDNHPEYLKAKYETRIIYLPDGKIDVSSRLIRERLKTNESVKDLIPEAVLDFITRNSLYMECI